MYAIHHQNDLKEFQYCKEHLATEANLAEHIEKYHTVTNINVEPIELLPEVTERRKNNLDELVIEDGWIVNIEELLQESDKE